MAPERRSGTKAVVTIVVVLLLSAIIAYFLHFRPVAETVPTPEDVRPTPREVGARPADDRAPDQAQIGGAASAIPSI